MSAAEKQPTDILLKRVLRDRAACAVYNNGAGADQSDLEAYEVLLTAAVKVYGRDFERVRRFIAGSALPEDVWGGLEDDIPKIADHLDRVAPTDDVLADEFARKHSSYAFGQRTWMRYDGAAWRPVDAAEVERDVQGVLVDAKPRKVKPSAALLLSVARFARNNAYVPDRLWDAKPDIVVSRDKTLDFAPDGTYTVRDNDPADYARDALPFGFDPLARCDVFTAFLGMLPDDVASLLQEYAGYSLTSDTSHELALWLLGERGSGRSTFIEGLLAMLGGRAGRLGLREIAESRFGLPAVVGKTFLYATESPSDYVKSADTLINLISGEPISVERKHKDAFEYRPGAKILWAMNSLPQLRDQHSGLWRRVKIIKFPGLDVAPNTDIKEAIKLEGPGILLWALEGLRRLRERGKFAIPESVESATEAYREENDLAAEFLRARRIQPGDVACKASTLTFAYNRWREVNGSGRVSTTTAKRDWERLGLKQGPRQSGGNVWMLNAELSSGGYE